MYPAGGATAFAVREVGFIKPQIKEPRAREDARRWSTPGLFTLNPYIPLNQCCGARVRGEGLPLEFSPLHPSNEQTLLWRDCVRTGPSPPLFHCHSVASVSSVGSVCWMAWAMGKNKCPT